MHRVVLAMTVFAAIAVERTIAAARPASTAPSRFMLVADEAGASLVLPRGVKLKPPYPRPVPGTGGLADVPEGATVLGVCEAAKSAESAGEILAAFAARPVRVLRAEALEWAPVGCPAIRLRSVDARSDRAEKLELVNTLGDAPIRSDAPALRWRILHRLAERVGNRCEPFALIVRVQVGNRIVDEHRLEGECRVHGGRLRERVWEEQRIAQFGNRSRVVIMGFAPANNRDDKRRERLLLGFECGKIRTLSREETDRQRRRVMLRRPSGENGSEWKQLDVVMAETGPCVSGEHRTRPCFDPFEAKRLVWNDAECRYEEKPWAPTLEEVLQVKDEYR